MVPELQELEKIQSEIRELEELKKNEPAIQEYPKDAVELSQKAKNHHGQPLGFKTLDGLLGGVSSGELIIITAPTYTGKTAFAQSITWNLAQVGIGSLWYSLEVSMWNFIQPFLSYTTKTAWTYGANIESTYDWKAKQWAVPLNLSVSKLTRFGKMPVSFAGGVGYWLDHSDTGAKEWRLRFVVTLLFPQ